MATLKKGVKKNSENLKTVRKDNKKLSLEKDIFKENVLDSNISEKEGKVGFVKNKKGIFGLDGDIELFFEIFNSLSLKPVSYLKVFSFLEEEYIKAGCVKRNPFDTETSGKFIDTLINSFSVYCLNNIVDMTNIKETDLNIPKDFEYKYIHNQIGTLLNKLMSGVIIDFIVETSNKTAEVLDFSYEGDNRIKLIHPLHVEIIRNGESEKAIVEHIKLNIDTMADIEACLTKNDLEAVSYILANNVEYIAKDGTHIPAITASKYVSALDFIALTVGISSVIFF